ncbi:tripartite tricarboxylate transporter TctB family protein [Parasulfitobacter algicola]|uniref:Tripartite tricarboxylate transporter TctB family protein n=1 Tax=Parasulfitobacter algicola TaxID=2614809 RepID=A0ABX2IU92_9RHOB|nr:tripartite tricarboxylate transporter TctB family protein [Sulfitobacter algicola]NSX53758.1 tripartite tricarboxylate transporter TctB family protein [Sulfitobacter algicola]
MNRFLHRDLVPGIALLVLGGYMLWEARQMSVFGAIFPQLAGAGMVLCALAMVLRAWIVSPASAPPDGALLRPILMLATLLGWAVILPLLGFIPTSLIGAGLSFCLYWGSFRHP